MSRRIATRLNRREVFQIYGNACAKCGVKRGLELHHVLPIVYGGKDTAQNVIPLCPQCHKHAPDYFDEFIRYMSDPYTPTISLAMTLSRATCNFLAACPEEKLSRLQVEGGDAFFEREIEPNIIGVLKWLNGFEERETEYETKVDEMKRNSMKRELGNLSELVEKVNEGSTVDICSEKLKRVEP